MDIMKALLSYTFDEALSEEVMMLNRFDAVTNIFLFYGLFLFHLKVSFQRSVLSGQLRFCSNSLIIFLCLRNFRFLHEVTF